MRFVFPGRHIAATTRYVSISLRIRPNVTVDIDTGAAGEDRTKEVKEGPPDTAPQPRPEREMRFVWVTAPKKTSIQNSFPETVASI